MLALVLAALRARRAQAFTLLLLSTLAAAAAAAAPWYVMSSTERIATRYVETAPIRERSLETIGEGPIDGGSVAAQVEAQAEQTSRIVGLTGFTTYTQAFIAGQAATGVGTGTDGQRATTSALVYRADVCGHAVIEGRCASAAGEAMVSSRTARWLRLKPGDAMDYVSASLTKIVKLTVVGIYRPDDPNGAYWSSNDQLLATTLPSGGIAEITEPVDDAVFVPAAALDAMNPSPVRTIADLIAAPSLLVDHDPLDVRAALNASTVEAANNRLTLNTQLHATIDKVERDRQLVSLGVPVGALQLLALCWFALYLAVKYTGEERRPDIGLVKLRGATRLRTWALVSGQSALPMLAGAVLGLPIGYLAATAVTGAIRSQEGNRQALTLSIAAAVVAVLGALLAAMLAERRSLASSVAELLRQASARSRLWRDIFDLVLVVVAVAAVYQVKQRASGDAAGLTLLAPGLAALAFALVAARLITFTAARVVEGALRHGRPARALTAIYLARRPGVHRLAALMIVTVALLATSALTWSDGRSQGRNRAELEVGASRVLFVRAGNRAALLDAVRGADPGGRQAMAAVESLTSGHDRVLLVDSPRLAAVATWRPEYGMSAAETAAVLHPAAQDAVKVTGGELSASVTTTLDPAVTDRTVYLDLVLAGPTGARLGARLGPLTNGPQTLKAAVPACATAPGCRLGSMQLLQSTLEQKIFFAARPGVDVVVHGVRQTGPDAEVLGPAALADRARWRLGVGVNPPNLVISPAGTGGADGMRMTVRPVQQGTADAGVYPMDSPAPLSTVRATRLEQTVLGDQRVSFGSVTVAERVAGTAVSLPRLGKVGVLADLEYADRLSGDYGGGESLQVWLAAGAPDALVRALQDRGLIVLGEQTIDGVAAQYASFGPPLTLQFMLLSAIVGLALAIGSAAVVAAVERRPRGRELAALRTQGAPARVVQRVSVEGYLVLAGASLLFGLLLTVLIRTYIGDVLPYFADGWSAP